MLDRLKILLGTCRPHLLFVLLLVITTFAVYGRILNHEFLSNWDDNRYILENPDVQGFSWQHLKVLFSRYYVGNYAPVHLLSYTIDHALWGLRPGAFLFTNLLLHTINGLLLYRLFTRLLDDRLAAWFGAALFLLHPVQVETVAWISQRKNLLAMLFFLLAWEFYLAYRDGGKTRGRLYYALSLMALLLALLSKSVAVVFPLAMLLFDHCYPSASGKPRFLDKGPYLLISVAVAVLAVLSQTPDYTEWGAGGGRAPYHGGSAMATFLTMSTVFCSYLRIIVLPFNLSALYDPVIHKSVDPAVLAAFLFLGGIAYLIYRLYRHDRCIVFWPLFAILALLPVAQIVPLVTLMNDRYLYFPLIGVAALMAYGCRQIGLRCLAHPLLVPTAMGILLFSYAVISVQRCGIWRDASTLWSDTVRKSPNSSVAWEALAEARHYTSNPRFEEAITAYRRAIELNPNGDISRYNLGVAYIELNDFVNGDKVLQELLRRSPNNVMGWAAYGDSALRQLDFGEAEKRYKKAMELQPEAVQVHRKIGNLMVVTGRFAEARSSFLRIEALQGENDPLNAYELARIESLMGDTGASLRWLERALQRGYYDFAGILADEELTPVMSDGRFADLVSKYFPKQQ